MSVQPTQTLRCGDAWTFSATLQNNDGSTPNLAGCSIIFKIDTLDLTENVLTLSLGMGVTVTNQTNAVVQFEPTMEQTADIAPGTYYYTLQVLFPDGVTAYTYVEGMIVALPAMV